ncbi:MAG: restriction endonuclease subunit S, partial [Oscillospiraceae bacterium]|nr:restriction endonuclease subunit S [Oscillospiraceae bacterium]
MTKNNNVPQIRFKGFTDTWEQREFKNTFDFLQNNALSRAELSEEQGSAMNVHYGDILVKFGEVLDVSSEPLPYVIDEATVKKYSSSKLQNGDVIIADAAEDETVGKCTEIANLQDETVLAGLHTIPIRTKEEFSCGYLG